MDGYKITNIDPITSCVKLSFDYQGNHRDWEIYIDLSDSDAITKACDQEYANFQAEIDNIPILTPEVEALVGNTKTSLEVATSLKLTPIKAPMEVI